MLLALAVMLILRIAAANLVLGFGDSGTGDATGTCSTVPATEELAVW